MYLKCNIPAYWWETNHRQSWCTWTVKYQLIGGKYILDNPDVLKKVKYQLIGGKYIVDNPDVLKQVKYQLIGGKYIVDNPDVLKKVKYQLIGGKYIVDNPDVLHHGLHRACPQWLKYGSCGDDSRCLPLGQDVIVCALIAGLEKVRAVVQDKYGLVGNGAWHACTENTNNLTFAFLTL